MEFNTKREKYLLKKAEILLEEVIIGLQNKKDYRRNKTLGQILVHYIYLNKIKEKVLNIHEKLYSVISKIIRR